MTLMTKRKEKISRTLFKGFVHGLVGSPDHFYGSGFGEGFSFDRMGLTWCYQDTRIEVWLVDDEFPVKYMCVHIYIYMYVKYVSIYTYDGYSMSNFDRIFCRRLDRRCYKALLELLMTRVVFGTILLFGLHKCQESI